MFSLFNKSNIKKNILFSVFSLFVVFNSYSMQQTSNLNLDISENRNRLFNDRDSFKVFKNIVRSLSTTISKSLFVFDNEKAEMANEDLYGIFFDTFSKNYYEIMDRIVNGDQKDIQLLSKQLLSEIYEDIEIFVEDYENSDDYLLQNIVRNTKVLIRAIKKNENDVLEKIQQVFAGFEKNAYLGIIKDYLFKAANITRKTTMVVSGGVTVLALLAKKYENSYYAPIIIPYSRGIFIAVTITPSIVKWVYSLF